MKILITGGCGFVGSRLVAGLIASNHKVAIVDSFKPKVMPSAVSFYPGDIYIPKTIGSIIKEEKPEVIYHLADNLNNKVESSMQDGENMQKKIASLFEMCEAAKNYGVLKIVFASSAAVYGRSSVDAFSEDMLISPVDSYGLGKYISEGILWMYYKKYNIPCAILRYSTVYGPNQIISNKGSSVANFMRKIDKGEVIEINNRIVRDFIFIDDITAANIKALEPQCVGIYNISTGTGLSFGEIIDKIYKIFGKKPKKKYKKSKISNIDISILDNTKIKRDVNWFPKIAINEGLRLTIEHFNENRKN